VHRQRAGEWAPMEYLVAQALDGFLRRLSGEVLGAPVNDAVASHPLPCTPGQKSFEECHRITSLFHHTLELCWSCAALRHHFISVAWFRPESRPSIHSFFDACRSKP
jgi:hypothetical protein